uniref:Cysteine sulfinic acid decarboxylase n=1 Tax=Myotis myotis TaxID=51298 RepID=A0A7J7Z1U0_MYOMY|nr:cysteine sulfinic acid decarboxylase [Myotis myotis]
MGSRGAYSPCSLHPTFQMLDPENSHGQKAFNGSGQGGWWEGFGEMADWGWSSGGRHSNSPWLLGGGEAEAPFTEVWKGKAAWLGSLRKSQLTQLCCAHPRADSVAWNPHKLLTAGLQCSALLLRDTTNLLKRCHGSQASYLFQQDKFYDVALDTGDKVVQCGRRVDCLKLWLMWKAQGGQGLERRVNQAFALARYLAEEMKKREGFELVMEPEFVNVCFWFVPPSLRGKQESLDYSERLAKVAPVLKERMVKEGSMMIGYQPHGTRGNFFRLIVANPALTQADMDFLLNELERLGQDL